MRFRHIAGIAEDISQIKQAEEAHHEVQKLRVLTQTAGAAAHEINQPLTVIMEMADILLAKSNPNGSERERLQTL